LAAMIMDEISYSKDKMLSSPAIINAKMQIELIRYSGIYEF